MRKLDQEEFFKLKCFNQTFRSRLRFTVNENPRPTWWNAFKTLFELASVVEEHAEELDFNDFVDINGMYRTAQLLHDQFQPKSDPVGMLVALEESSLPIYIKTIATALGFTEDKMASEMAKYGQQIFSTESAVRRQTMPPLVTNRPLKESETRTIVPITPSIQKEELVTMRKRSDSRIEVESTIKRTIAGLLKESYENLIAFDEKYERYKNYHIAMTDIASCTNLIIKNAKIKKYKEHLTAMQRYRKTMFDLYTTSYTAFRRDDFEITFNDLRNLRTIFALYHELTFFLLDTMGNYRVETLETRRLKLQQKITEYNAIVDEINLHPLYFHPRRLKG